MRRIQTAIILALSLEAAPAQAYPIDCAILLCLAGGFPASAECNAAKATMIQRITPFPVEPPLQLWNCPMGLSPDLASQLAISQSPDQLSPEVRAFRDAIEIYDIRHYSREQGPHGLEIIDMTFEGEYIEPGGTFRWVPSSYVHAPAWVAAEVGGTTTSTVECVEFVNNGPDGKVCTKTAPVSRNHHNGPLRAIVMRTKAYDGTFQQHVVRY